MCTLTLPLSLSLLCIALSDQDVTPCTHHVYKRLTCVKQLWESEIYQSGMRGNVLWFWLLPHAFLQFLLNAFSQPHLHVHSHTHDCLPLYLGVDLNRPFQYSVQVTQTHSDPNPHLQTLFQAFRLEFMQKIVSLSHFLPTSINGDRNGWIDGWREPLQLLLLMLLCVLSLLSSFFAFHSGWRSGLISITTAKEEFFKTRRPLDLSSRICLRSQTGQQKNKQIKPNTTDKVCKKGLCADALPDWLIGNNLHLCFFFVSLKTGELKTPEEMEWKPAASASVCPRLWFHKHSSRVYVIYLHCRVYMSCLSDFWRVVGGRGRAIAS